MAELAFHIAAVIEAGQRIGDRHLDRGLDIVAELLGIAAAADLRIDAGEKFLAVDRADQIVVHAHVEGAHEALVVVGIDDDQDGRLAGMLERLELRAQPQAVDILHVEIDDDEFDSASLAGDCTTASCGSVDRWSPHGGRQAPT